MAIVIPYVKQTWTDGSSSASAARFGVIEEGVFDVSYSPAVRVTHNAAQSVTNTTPLALAFNTERIDQAGNASSTMHDTVTNNSRLTAVYAGVYQISGLIEWAANATGYRAVFIRLNGATTIGGVTGPANASVITRQCVTCIYAMAVNDYVELLADQSSGGGLNVNATSNTSPEFMMVRVG